MTALRHYWTQLTHRERILIQVMACLILGLSIWLGIIRPIERALATAQQDVAIAARNYQAIQFRAAAIKRLPRHRPEPLGLSVDALIAQSATDRGLSVVPDGPSAGAAALWRIDQASPRAVFGWLETLEGRGVLVKTLVIDPVGGDFVSVTVAFQSTSD
jgi:general secretion pathway protein M